MIDVLAFVLTGSECGFRCALVRSLNFSFVKVHRHERPRPSMTLGYGPNAASGSTQREVESVESIAIVEIDEPPRFCPTW